MPKSTELRVRGKRLHVTEALARNERYGRCVECGKPVRVHARGKNGAAAHVEHIDRNRKCPLSDHRVY